MTEIRIPVPRIPAGLVSNLVGLLGLIAIAVSIGGLTGNWWWSVLSGGVFAVGLAYHAAAPEQEQASIKPAEPARMRPAGVRSA